MSRMDKIVDVATIVLAIGAVVLAFLTLRANRRAVQMQRRDTRRLLAGDLRNYAFWYCERVVSEDAPEVGPADALSDENFALTAFAGETGEKGAKDLVDWALNLLETERQGQSGLRPYEAAHLIAQVASTWVVNLKLDVKAHADKELQERSKK